MRIMTNRPADRGRSRLALRVVSRSGDLTEATRPRSPRQTVTRAGPGDRGEVIPVPSCRAFLPSRPQGSRLAADQGHRDRGAVRNLDPWLTKLVGVAGFGEYQSQYSIHPFRGCETRERRLWSCPCTRDGAFGNMNMDLGDSRLGCSAAASADLLGGGQAGVRKPRRLKITSQT
jgi:hypothetical protein